MSAYQIADCIISDAIINDYRLSEDGNQLHLRLLAIGANKNNIKAIQGPDFVRITTKCEYDEEFNEDILLTFKRDVEKVEISARDGFMFIDIKYVERKCVKVKVVQL